MAILDPETFKRLTAPSPKIGIGKLTIGAGYGSNMMKVLAALEAYWEQRTSCQIIREQHLYNLWKVSNNWLDLKSGKAQKEGASDLFHSRKVQVELLRYEALAELENISPKVAAAFQHFQAHKQQQGPLGYKMKGLSNGYHVEREHYLQGSKQSGATISGSKLAHAVNDPGKKPKAQYIAQKGFGNLSLKDAQALQQLFPLMPPVVYMNKIARLKYMVWVADGKLCDADGPVLMTGKFSGLLELVLYVMDKYGHLYVTGDWNKKHGYLERGTGGKYEEKTTTQFNHSSLLAGADVLCAGALHIGWDNRRQGPSAGVLSSINNGSGHYQPSTANLRTCLEALQAMGVDIEWTRVGDYAQPKPDEKPALFWGRDFMANCRNPWVDENTPSSVAPRLGIQREAIKAPPINFFL
jgi:hypothetical protein